MPCFILTSSNDTNFQLIISMLLDNTSIENVKLSIKSILNQNIDKSLYKLILMVSNKNKNIYLSEKFISFIKEYNIQLNIIKNRYKFQNRLITTFKNWNDKPILIINNNIIFPEGWLEMYINDNKKYPNDIIVCTVQYFIGKNMEIKNFSEGYKGQYFGIFIPLYK